VEKPAVDLHAVSQQLSQCCNWPSWWTLALFVITGVISRLVS